MPLNKWSFESRHKVVLIYIALAVFGLVMIYSASFYSAGLSFGDELYYVKKQAIAMLAGLVFAVFGGMLNTKYLVKWRYFVLAFSLVLLAMVFIPGLGVESYGATRWLNLGFMTIQPSEFAKFGLMFFLAAELSVRPPNCIKNLIIPIVAILAVCGLIILEPNMSITMTVAVASMFLLFVAGIKGKYIAVLAVLAGIAVPVMIVLEPYRMERLVAYLDPWANPKAEGYQLIQSYYALGSGKLFGVGLFNSVQKYLFLPFAESDFIFAIVGEELGFIGSFVVMLLYFLMIIYGIKIAKSTENRADSFLASGVVAILAVQSLLNLAVVSGTIPPTGVPLPLISAGGSSLMAFSFGIGILFNVERRTQIAKNNHTI